MTPFAMAAGTLVFCGAAMSGAMAGEVSGREAFAPCRACHSLEKNAGVMPGPSLSGLIGRAVGGDPEYQYSPVLRDARDAGLIWTEQRLEKFLSDPEGMFPGMWMSYPGIRDEHERSALRGFIISAGKPDPLSPQQKGD